MSAPRSCVFLVGDKSIGLSHPAKTAGNVTGGTFIPIAVSFAEEGAWKLQKWAPKPPIELGLPALNSLTEDQFVPILSPTQ